MSDSDDDFMSDKYLVDVPQESTYSARRSRAALAGQRRGQAHNARNLPLREREAERRREGLNRSLFDEDKDETSGSGTSKSSGKPAAAPKALDFMRKMGWTPGESLGRRRSASPDPKRKEPVRISMWAGRKGLTARSPSPPPLRRLGPDDLGPEAHARLETEASTFRGRRGADFAARDAGRKAYKARALLVEKDAAKGIKFHPLHANPVDPESLPRPLLIRLYPELDTTRSRSPSPEVEAPAPAPTPAAVLASSRIVSSAEKLREQMRRDMLADLGGEDEEQVRFGVKIDKEEKPSEPSKEEEEAGEEPDWEEMMSGTKRVLAMTPEENLAFLVSQLRHEHLFCFWCGSQYASWAEMDAPGGCPGEDEDDH